MHGDLAYPESIVLTRGQFVGFSAAAGPSGAVLQSLLLTKHVLVIGASMTDDNVLRLIHEVTTYRQLHRPEMTTTVDDKLGTLLDVDDDAARCELHRSQFHIHQMPATDLNDRARNLEIFLDGVAMHACSDNSWLLDQRFEFLHDESSRNLAGKIRDLAAQVRQVKSDGPSSSWEALARSLDSFGAVPGATRRW